MGSPRAPPAFCSDSVTSGHLGGSHWAAFMESPGRSYRSHLSEQGVDGSPEQLGSTVLSQVLTTAGLRPLSPLCSFFFFFMEKMFPFSIS